MKNKYIIILMIIIINLNAIDEWKTEHTTISKKVNLENVITNDNLISIILITPINSHSSGNE